MTILIGKIVGRPYKTGKKTIYKFLVLEGQYKSNNISNKKIEVYGTIDELDPVLRRTILTIEGEFGRKRKDKLPYFQIYKTSSIVDRVELDDVEVVSEYLGMPVSQTEYNSAMQTLKADNYMEASRIMTDTIKRKEVSESHPQFARLVKYLAKEKQIIDVARLFQETNCGLDISHATQVCLELQYRAERSGKSVDELIENYPWILTQVLDVEVAEEAARIIANYNNHTEQQQNKELVASRIINLLFERMAHGDCFTYLSVIYGRLLSYGHSYNDIRSALDFLSSNTYKNRVFGKIVFTSKNIADIAKDTGRSYSKENKDPSKQWGIYLSGIFFSEYEAARKLAKIISTPGSKLDANEVLFFASKQLTDEQKDFIKTACTSKITVLTGEAGTGKSFALKSLINAYQKATGREPVVLAPTALASYLLGEGTVVKDNTKTIHRYAHIYKQSDADLAVDVLHSYTANNNEEMDSDLIIIDECSMLGPVVLRKLLDTVNPETRIIFAGDPGQLPPVGASGTFPSLIRLAEEGIISHINLTENKRSAEDVIRVASSIRKNETSIPVGESVNLHITKENEIIEQLIQCIKNKGGYDPQLMVLVPYRNPGKHNKPLNVGSINEALSKEFGSGQKIGNTGFMVGDPILAKRNDYADTKTNYPRFIKEVRLEREHDVYNGTRGRIIDYNQETEIVTIEYYTGRKGKQKYHIDELAYFVEQAYCTTIHKAQGGQAKQVILVLANAQNNRPLIYTGITRCKSGGTVDIITTNTFTILSNAPEETVEEEVDNWENLGAFQCLSSFKYLVLRELDDMIVQHKPFKSRKKLAVAMQ